MKLKHDYTEVYNDKAYPEERKRQLAINEFLEMLAGVMPVEAANRIFHPNSEYDVEITINGQSVDPSELALTIREMYEQTMEQSTRDAHDSIREQRDELYRVSHELKLLADRIGE
jgi:uncharacterized membrane protein